MNHSIQQLETQLSQATGLSERLELLHRLLQAIRPENLQQARSLAEQAAELAENASVEEQAQALKDLGDCLYDLGEYKAAQDCFLQALSGQLATPRPQNLAPIQFALAQVFEQQGEFPQALKQYIAALELAEQAGLRALEANTLDGIANLQQTLGNYPEAAKYALRSLSLRRSLGHSSDEVGSLSHLGQLYLEMGDYQGAVALYQESLELARSLEDTLSQAKALFHLGIAYSHLGYHTPAIQSQESALVLAHELGIHSLEADVLEQMGRSKAALGSAGQALELFHQARSLYQSQANRAHETRTLVQMGLTLQQLGQPGKALETLNQALTASEELGLRRTRLDALHALSRVYEQNADLAQSLRHLKVALELERTLFQELQVQQTAALLASFGFEQMRQQAATIQRHNLELAQLNTELAAAIENLRETNTEKTKLLNKLGRQAEELERLARQDALTRLYNRRYLEENLAREFSASQRYGYPLSVALLDLDRFKAINDTFSHQLGDQVLRIVANILESSCRGTDFAARYGGEEFALVMPQTDLTGAVIACERIRQKVDEYPWQHLHPDLHVTLSIGVSQNSDLVDHEKLLSEADTRLYRAKNSGRNRVVF